MALVWRNLQFQQSPSLLGKLSSVCCCGVCCELKPKENILSDLNGRIERGELIALMGPSGAGKSTFLNCITQGMKYHGCGGELFVDGLDPSEAVRASLINQDEKEHLLFDLTVNQSLMYASKLRNKSETPNNVHCQIIRDLISELDLKGTENTKISKCSGGQRKRIAIAMELTAIAKPHFLLLDEPTSGLDSFVGLKVVQLLSSIARTHNMTIITTIHQPSFRLFSFFARAYILSGTGRIIYNGPPMQLLQFIRYCGYNGGLLDNFENPADIAIEIASAMTRNMKGLDGRLAYVNLARGDNQCLAFDESQVEDRNSTIIGILATENLKICITMINKVNENDSRKHANNRPYQGGTRMMPINKSGLCKNGSNFGFHNLWVLIRRNGYTSIWQQKKLMLTRFALHATVAGLLAILYTNDIGSDGGCVSVPSPSIMDNIASNVSNLQPNSHKDPLPKQNVQFQFFSLLFLMFAALMPTVLTFPAEIKLFLNEFRNGWYSTSSYYIAKTLTEIPLQLLFACMYTYFIYWYSGQIGMEHWYSGLVGDAHGRYLQYLGITILCCFVAQGVGFLIGVLCVRSFNMSIIVSSSLLLFFFLFSGIFVKRVEMPSGASWITYLSFVRFGFESLLITIYGYDRCVSPEVPSVLTDFGLKDTDMKFNFWMLFVHLLAIRIAALFALVYIADPSILICSDTINTIFDKFLNFCSRGAGTSSYSVTANGVRKWIIRIIQFVLLLYVIQILVALIRFVFFDMFKKVDSENSNSTNF